MCETCVQHIFTRIDVIFVNVCVCVRMKAQIRDIIHSTLRMVKYGAQIRWESIVRLFNVPENCTDFTGRPRAKRFWAVYLQQKIETVCFYGYRYPLFLAVFAPFLMTFIEKQTIKLKKKYYV